MSLWTFALFNWWKPPNVVHVSGARAGQPSTLKASVGIDGGFIGSGAISYAGRIVWRKRNWRLAIVQERWATLYGREPAQLHLELIGVNSCTPWRGGEETPAVSPPEAAFADRRTGF